MDSSPSMQQRVARKRNRVPISCNHCRFRKLKCSRAKPCESCIKSGDATTCSYIAQEFRGNHQASLDSGIKSALESRIDKLEAVLTTAIAHNFQGPSSAPETERSSDSSPPILDIHAGRRSIDATNAFEDPKADTLSGSFGVMKIDPDQTIHYMGGAHWVSIISEIAEFRTYLATNYDDLERAAKKSHSSSCCPAHGTSSLLRGTHPPTTREHILSLVPPRAVADQLIQIFFHPHLASVHFMHETTFMNSYYEHWNDPSKTKTAWLGMFFAMINIAELCYQEIEDAYSANQSLIYWERGIDQYREATIKCLIASEYTKPSTYTIETLMLYVDTEWLKSQDPDIELSAVLSMTIRLAMGMGIHRDSKQHPLSVFQAEMRRRIWAAIMTKDILYSIQLSLPTTIHQSDCDCALPRNLRDIDFDETSEALPPPRDISEPTEISYIIAKYRRTLLLAKVSTLAESRNNLNPTQIQEYRNALQEIHTSTPPHLKMAAPEEMASNPRWLTQQQLGLDRVYQFAHCILHRKFLAPSHRTPTPQLLEYRRSCIDAAMTLLHHQAILYQEYTTSPETIQKRHISNLTSHDFYIADMAVALDLHFALEYEYKPGVENSNDIAIWGYDRRVEMIKLLEASNEFWKMAKETSREASKAHGIFWYILRKVKSKLGMSDLPAEVEPSSVDGLASSVGLDGNPDAWMFSMEEDQAMLDFDWNLWDEHYGEGGVIGFEDIT